MQKISRLRFFLFGINYIVGFGFIATISSSLQLGFYGFIPLVLATLFTGFYVLSSIKGVERFPGEIGGTYVYAKAGLSRFWVFFQGWNQYMQGPMLASSAPLFLAEILGGYFPKYKIFFSIISVLFFLLLIIIASLGAYKATKIIFIFASVKWFILVVTGFLMIFMIVSDLNWAGNVKTFQFADKTNQIGPKIYQIARLTISFLYAFGGFGSLVAISADTQIKNWKQTLLSILLIVITIYYVAFFSFLGINFYKQQINLNSNTFSEILRIIGQKFSNRAAFFGILIFSLASLLNQSASRISTAFSESRSLVPLSLDGFLFKFIAQKNTKTGEYRNAFIFSTILVIFSMIFLNLIPSFLFSKAAKENLFLAVVGIGSLAFLMQYLMQGITILILSYKKIISPLSFVSQFFYILIIIFGFSLILVIFLPFILLQQKAKIEDFLPFFAYASFMILGFILNFISKKLNPNYDIKNYYLFYLKHNLEIPKNNFFKSKIHQKK